jgi:hypothetical protein
MLVVWGSEPRNPIGRPAMTVVLPTTHRRELVVDAVCEADFDWMDPDDVIVTSYRTHRQPLAGFGLLVDTAEENLAMDVLRNLGIDAADTRVVNETMLDGRDGVLVYCPGHVLTED